jgi:hypothetical protein
VQLPHSLSQAAFACIDAGEEPELTVNPDRDPLAGDAPLPLGLGGHAGCIGLNRPGFIHRFGPELSKFAAPSKVRCPASSYRIYFLICHSKGEIQQADPLEAGAKAFWVGATRPHRWTIAQLRFTDGPLAYISSISETRSVDVATTPKP